MNTNFLTKLSELKIETGKLSKDSTNPFFKSKYFDINQLLEHIEPICAAKKLLILQPIINDEVVSQIFDIESGDKIESSIKIPQYSDPQKTGSAITYYRRYTLQSLLGLQAEEDDANKASGRTTPQSQTPENKQPNNSTQNNNLPWLNENDNNWKAIAETLKGGKKVTMAALNKRFQMSKATKDLLIKTFKIQ